MILSEKKVDSYIRNEKWLILAGMLLLIAVVIWLIGFSGRKPVMQPEDDLIVCDAENVSGDQFVNGDFTYARGNLQSDERSRSGNFSCKISKGKGIQYGFGYQLKQFQPGEVYRVSVWRFRNPQQEGRLVIQNSGGQDFYRMEEIPVEVEESGWEKLSTTFVIPFGEQPDYYNIYVYASGFHEVFFDDLVIE